MIKPDMIPDKVARGAAYAFYNADTGLGIVDDWKTAIAAALNAWPGMEIEMVGEVHDFLILPVTKEKTDE